MTRYTSATDDDRRQMLDAIGVGSIDELFEDIPDDLRLGRPLELPDGKPETINDDPYGAGWMVRIKMSDTSETDALMDQAAYTQSLS